MELYIGSPPSAFTALCLIKHRGSSTFHLGVHYIMDQQMLVTFSSETKIILTNILSNKLRLPTPFSLFCPYALTISYDTKNKILTLILRSMCTKYNRLCSLVVRVPGYKSRDPGFDSQRYQVFWEVVGLERGSLSLVRITEELLEGKNSGSGPRKSRPTVVGIRCADTRHPLSEKVGTNFADIRRSLCRYSSLAD
jgi:hypothetical protein